MTMRIKMKSNSVTKRKNSISSLVNLYTVVIGVALTYSVTGLFQLDSGLKTINKADILLFIAFVVTLVPFFHGALRHLNDSYLENANPHIKDGALIIDFLLLFLHALFFVILSQLVKLPSNFAWVLVVLLSIDVIWGVIAHFAFSASKGFTAESKWTIINLVFVSLSVWYLIANKITLDLISDPINLAIPILIACSFRSLADYVWCKDFYFPK